MSTWALVPAYNEARRIASTVEAITGTGLVDGIIVVDDGSADDTAALAHAAGAHLEILEHNMGKGAALSRGLDWLGEHAADATVVLLDADLAETAAEAGALIEPVVAGRADMTIARFPRPTGKAGFGLVKGLARWGIARLRRARPAVRPARPEPGSTRRVPALGQGLRGRGRADDSGTASRAAGR